MCEFGIFIGNAVLRPRPRDALVVGLIGLCDVRDYRLDAADPNRRGVPSPFNMLVSSLSLRDFTADEVGELYQQHTEETGQRFEPEAIQRAFELSRGQPWLVNALAQIVVDDLVPDAARPVTVADVNRAQEVLIARRDVHLDSLAARLDEPRIRAILEPMLAGELLGNVPEDDRRFATDLGLVRETDEGGLEVANPIYREVIARSLASGVRATLPRTEPIWLTPDGRLDPDRLLAAFLAFWRQHGEPLLKAAPYAEVAPHLVLMAFLDRVANGGGALRGPAPLGLLAARWAGSDAQRYQERVIQMASALLGRADGEQLNGWRLLYGLLREGMQGAIDLADAHPPATREEAQGVLDVLVGDGAHPLTRWMHGFADRFHDWFSPGAVGQTAFGADSDDQEEPALVFKILARLTEISPTIGLHWDDVSYGWLAQIRSIDGNAGAWQDIERQISSTAPAWALWRRVARFMVDPSSLSLAGVLRAAADEDAFTELDDVCFSLPWPIGACLAYARTHEAMLDLSAEIQEGRFGSLEDWRAAEARWRKSPSIVLDEVGVWLDADGVWNRDIASRGMIILWWFRTRGDRTSGEASDAFPWLLRWIECHAPPLQDPTNRLHPQLGTSLTLLGLLAVGDLAVPLHIAKLLERAPDDRTLYLLRDLTFLLPDLTGPDAEGDGRRRARFALLHTAATWALTMDVQDGPITMTLTRRSHPMPVAKPSDAAVLSETLALLRRARRHFRGAIATLLVAGAAAGAAGCGAAPTQAPPVAAEQRGPAGALRGAIDELDLDAGQRARALEIAEGLSAATAPVRVERQRVAAALADRIAAGTLTRADAEAALAELAKAEQAAVPALEDAANRLHGVLDAGQREDLLDALRDGFHERWRGHDGPRARLKQLAEDLVLTEEQRDTLRAKVKDEMRRSTPGAREQMEGLRERLRDAADAFASDDFDAGALGLGAEGIALRQMLVGATLRVVEVSLPALTPAQRLKVADFIRARAGDLD